MLQGQEIIIILLLALVVLGPQRLPEVARKLGSWAAELRKAANDLRQGLESEVGGLKELQKEVITPLQQARKTLTDTTNMAATSPLKWTGPKPATGPTPEDAAADLAQITETGEAATDQIANTDAEADEPGGSAE